MKKHKRRRRYVQVNVDSKESREKREKAIGLAREYTTTDREFWDLSDGSRPDGVAPKDAKK